MHVTHSLISADTIIEARWVCPVVPSHTVLENQSVIVQAGKITEICATEFARTKYVSNEVVQLNHQILIPGLINLHTHAAMSRCV